MSHLNVADFLPIFIGQCSVFSCTVFKLFVRHKPAVLCQLGCPPKHLGLENYTAFLAIPIAPSPTTPASSIYCSFLSSFRNMFWAEINISIYLSIYKF
jgi:hypothetical protein